MRRGSRNVLQVDTGAIYIESHIKSLIIPVFSEEVQRLLPAPSCFTNKLNGLA